MIRSKTKIALLYLTTSSISLFSPFINRPSLLFMYNHFKAPWIRLDFILFRFLFFPPLSFSLFLSPLLSNLYSHPLPSLVAIHSTKLMCRLEMMCVRVGTYIKNYFLIQRSDFGVTYELYMSLNLLKVTLRSSR